MMVVQPARASWPRVDAAKADADGTSAPFRYCADPLPFAVLAARGAVG